MITVEHLRKCYGDVVAVDDLSFEIEEGHVYGFLGPNGRGKVHYHDIMTGCLSATEGTVQIEGYDIFSSPTRPKAALGIFPSSLPSTWVRPRWNTCALWGRPRGCGGRSSAARLCR